MMTEREISCIHSLQEGERWSETGEEEGAGNF